VKKIVNRRSIAGALIILGIVALAFGAMHGPALASCDAHSLSARNACPLAASGGNSEVSTEAAMPSAASSAGTGARTPGAENLSALQEAIRSGSSLRPGTIAPITLGGPLHWPVIGPITQPFGVPELGVGLPHTGLDIGLDPGSPVHAARAGRVVFSGGDPCCGLGYWVEVNHGDNYSTRYGHLMRPPTVLSGDYVSDGQVLGFSGSTGFSTGPHLHFEVRIDGVPIDPLRALAGR
jgi:murein DD-endopeptidase MepM/ murein hydrolase activator NlpD